MASSHPYVQLDFAAKGCPVCRIVRIREERWIWHILYECTGDPDIRHQFDASHGLCHRHAHLMLRVCRRHPSVGIGGAARMYESVLFRSLDDLQGLARNRGLGWWRRSPTLRHEPPTAPCLLCESSEGTARGQVFFLLQALHEDSDRWKPELEASDGLCLPHFRLALEDGRAIRHLDLRDYLVSEQRRRMGELTSHITEFLRKQSYDVRDPILPQEAESCDAAVWRLNGMEFSELLWREESRPAGLSGIHPGRLAQ